MKCHQIISAHSRIIQVLISFEHTTFNIIPKSLVTLQFLKLHQGQPISGYELKAYEVINIWHIGSFFGHWDLKSIS